MNCINELAEAKTLSELYRVMGMAPRLAAILKGVVPYVRPFAPNNPKRGMAVVAFKNPDSSEMNYFIKPYEFE